MRVWLPDRPGALGSVASRIGAVRGDLVGIDILERGGGRVIDELAVELPDEDLLPLLLQEIGEVDGVDVEDARPVGDWSHDPRLDALVSAGVLAAQVSQPEILSTLARHAARDFEADWAAVVAKDGTEYVVSIGSPPEAAWLAAFAAGSGTSEAVAAGDGGPDDIAYTLLPAAGVALTLGRAGRPFRSRERHQLAALANIADVRWSQLA